MLMKATIESFANRNAIFWHFSIPLMTRWHINWYYYVQKTPLRAVADKQKASVKELVVDNSTNNSSSYINKISVFGKGKYCFSDPKDRQVKHY